ncbi:uncharacterized protein LOC132612098 [Lycium barbarum]|uniref:uncharacterized protein LOC132612098 n=1 Tax=Lycium barbarum TaxID=112863 RepID=UPI00293E91AA|nr:uncharacterized protein LOC132612098 [Lycium barbarum]
MRHVFLDFDNKEDHLEVSSRNFVTFEGDHVMKILTWSTKFKPEMKTTHTPVWITLLGLIWHYYEWDALCRILAPVGIPLTMDKATTTKTRPTTTKVRVEIDLMKSLVHEINIHILNSNGNFDIITQRVEYESVPPFCFHCKVQGHQDNICRIVHPELKNAPKRNEVQHIPNNNHPQGPNGGEKREQDKPQQSPPQTKYVPTSVPNNNTNHLANLRISENKRDAIEVTTQDEEWKTVSKRKGKDGNINNNVKPSK